MNPASTCHNPGVFLFIFKKYIYILSIGRFMFQLVTYAFSLLVTMIYFTIFSSFIIIACGDQSKDYSDVLNSCLDSKTHKVSPGPESNLHKQCVPWKDRACCTDNTTRVLPDSDIGFKSTYNFNLDHCKEKQEGLSEECKRHFIQDFCFYECEPNIGPWKVKVERTFAKERFYNVPLCFSDCESWFNACRKDYTCVSNWPRHMNFSGGLGNRCPSETECRTFEVVYHNNASLFCNQVWDESFTVVPDDQLCMRIWFDGSKGNPNYHTAMEYLKLKSQKTNFAMPFASSTLSLAVLYFVTLVF